MFFVIYHFSIIIRDNDPLPELGTPTRTMCDYQLKKDMHGRYQIRACIEEML